VQLQVVQALLAAGRPVAIGLEMFPHTAQAPLDHWTRGFLTEEGFLALSRWYEHWGYQWDLYRDILIFARDHRLPLYGLNAPRDVVASVRARGLDGLTADERSHLPPEGVHVDSADFAALFKASVGEGDSLHGGLDDESLRRLLSAQATWDAVMAWNAVRALRAQPAAHSILVVLAGTGHVAYDVGIVRQAKRWLEGGIATVIPVPVAVPHAGVRIEQVRASFADFVWGVLPEPESPYPRLGISTRTDARGRRVVVHVEPGSAADRAGFAVDDVLLSMDGQALTEPQTLNLLLARKAWGQAASVVVKRGTEEKTLTPVFRRTLAPAAPPAATSPPKR
jgi:uncharacterized iron-regulated protein